MHKCVLIYLLLMICLLACFIFSFHYLELRPPAFSRITNSNQWLRDSVHKINDSPDLAALTALATTPPVRHVIKQATSEGDESSGSEVTTRQLYVTYHNNKGRLGNSMFKYASMTGIARAQGRTLVLHPSFNLNKTFHLKYPVPVEQRNTNGWPTIQQTSFSHYDTRLLSLPADDVKIDGYLQSFKYFESIDQQIRQEFTFHENIDLEASEILQRIVHKHRRFTLVGVHVRRGDFLGAQEYGYAVPEKSYFLKAFEWMKNEISRLRIMFVVVSNDVVWCRRMLTINDVAILPPAPASVHLAVLSKCDHVIMTGGTFGWWGSWLAGGHVVYFRRYMDNSTVLGKGFKKEDYYPPHWTGLDN